jgi:hypothetical protein
MQRYLETCPSQAASVILAALETLVASQESLISSNFAGGRYPSAECNLFRL